MTQTTKAFDQALEAIEELARQDKFSGTVLIRQHDEIIAETAYGLASRRWAVPVRP